MKLKKIFQRVVATVSLACLASVSLAVESNKVDVYSESQVNIVVSQSNPIFTIELKSNPTTGYSWFLREYDHDLLMPVKHEFIHQDKSLVGASGIERWRFKVKPAGFAVPQQSVIRMIYARPWQGADGSTQLVFRVSTN